MDAAHQRDFRVFSGDRELTPVEASKRVYTARSMPTTEAGIRTNGLGQVYVSLGEPDDSGAIAVRLHDKPLILLIRLRYSDVMPVYCPSSSKNS